MKVSIIIPSNLTPRKHSAIDLESKLIRAVNSALNQDYEDIEIMVIADGCKQTGEIMEKYFFSDKPGKIRFLEIPKQPAFSGNVRNAGINMSSGNIICYLDADDYLGTDHVSTIVKHFTGQWVWFNDLTLQGNEFKERECALKLGLCGTSNIAHRRDMSARWNERNTYGRDDWSFIQNLQEESPDGVKIETPSYVVCHIPFKRGYDI
jgi:glycosyltransferase involved in cell wall biosynthesis